jgi:hypothetical protein
MSKEDEMLKEWYAKAEKEYRVPGAQSIEDYGVDPKLKHYIEFTPPVDVVEPARNGNPSAGYWKTKTTIEEYANILPPTSRSPKVISELQLPR